MSREDDRLHLDHAARLGLRGHGRVEPNPMVGCVIVRNGELVGSGYHTRFGAPHAEVEGLRRAGRAARGGTAYITLEPCVHSGKTPPCTKALIDAGIARVVIAAEDPHPDHGGGATQLRDAGIIVEFTDCSPAAIDVSAPFRYRIERGLPWVIAKWAQTIDGRVAARSGESQWISGTRSRAMVHRERGRVDAILTGIGTVLADDPALTARGVRVRRIARRVIVDPLLQTPPTAKVIATARDVPTTIAYRADALKKQRDAAETLLSAGVELIPVEPDATLPPDGLPLRPVLHHLATVHDATTVLTECGGRLLGGLFEEALVNEAWVFTAPMILGDDAAHAAVRGLAPETLAAATRGRLLHTRRRDDDALSIYRFTE